MKKTITLYREVLAKGINNDTLGLLNAIIEVLKKYGTKTHCENYEIVFDRATRSNNFNWNHTIKGFTYCSNGKLYVDIYWQGDSTDGDDCVLFAHAAHGYTIPAAWDEVGGRWGRVCRHSPLDITRDEMDKAIKALAEYVSPKAVRARKDAREKAERERKMNETMEKRVDELCLSHQWKGYGDRVCDSYLNGKRAINELLKTDFEKFYNMSDEELKPILDKVFRNNNYPDSDFMVYGEYGRTWGGYRLDY